jgi:hypothetical protein
VASVLRPRRLGQQHTERGAADPRGPVWWIFHVRLSCQIWSFFHCLFRIHTLLDFASFCTLFIGDRSWRVELGRGTIALPD